MATKVNIMKLLQEMRGLSEIGRPEFASRKPALFMLHVRPIPGRRGRLRLFVATDDQDASPIPDPVPIRFLNSKDGPQD